MNAPQTEMEQALSALWREVLRVEVVAPGIHAMLPVELPVVDLTHLPEANREVEALRRTNEALPAPTSRLRSRPWRLWTS